EERRHKTRRGEPARMRTSGTPKRFQAERARTGTSTIARSFVARASPSAAPASIGLSWRSASSDATRKSVSRTSNCPQSAALTKKAGEGAREGAARRAGPSSAAPRRPARPGGGGGREERRGRGGGGGAAPRGSAA